MNACSIPGRPGALIDFVCNHSTTIADFQDVKGPGNGDRATRAFILAIGKWAGQEFGDGVAEQNLCGDTRFAVDFYFREEATIVEVALGLPNPLSEFEKDILKALVARDHEHPADRLVLVSRPGGKKKCRQPGRAAVIDWARRTHSLDIVVIDLPGEPRGRRRRRRMPAIGG